MKKIGLILLSTAVFAISSCEKEYIPQDVEFSIDYTFADSGSMTRTMGSDVYTNFYDKYIKTRILTPKTFDLTFVNKKTGATAKVEGKWDSKDAIRLIEGEYEVSGVSYPQDKKRSEGYPSDSVYLTFNETIYLHKDSKSITLNAIYDSYLLMFDKENSSEIIFETYNSGGAKPLYESDSIFTLFIKDLSFGSTGTYTHYIYVTRKNGSKSEIILDDIPFEKGKYYYFNDMNNSFDIPKMESGN